MGQSPPRDRTARRPDLRFLSATASHAAVQPIAGAVTDRLCLPTQKQLCRSAVLLDRGPIEKRGSLGAAPARTENLNSAGFQACHERPCPRITHSAPADCCDSKQRERLLNYVGLVQW